MPYLDVSAAKLYYEISGEGPVLLCISGANGSGDLWRKFAASMSKNFTVVIYDRRGFSRSQLSPFQPQDYSRRLATDADDAAALIRHVSKGEPATVLGNSSGAIVSLKLLASHPDVVKTLVSHEPPAMRLLPDFAELWIQQEDVYETYRAGGIAPALVKFLALTKTEHEKESMIAALGPPGGDPYTFGNMQYWFERELLVYPAYDVELDELRKTKEKLLPLNAEMTKPDALQFQGNLILAREFGLEVLLVPGAHLGFATHTEQFAEKLLELLSARK